MATYPPHVQKLISFLRNKLLSDNSSQISISDKLLSTMNKNHQGLKTILMMAVGLGKIEDVALLVKINGLDVNRRNDKDDTAADISWDMKNYDILMILLQNESIFPKEFSLHNVDTEGAVKDELKLFVEERERLHEWIRVGDLNAIENYTKNHKPSVYYSTDNVSALSCAIEYKRNEICAHLSSIKPNFSIPEMVKEEIHRSLDPEKSHILKLVHATRVSENKKGEEWNAITDMYIELDKHEEIRSLMKVIEKEDFEVYIEIKSTQVAIPGKDEKVFGITMPDGRIFIGGQGITSKEGYRKIHGVFAHEIGHLAMRLMYDNCWNPYHQGDKERKEIFTKFPDLYEKKKDIDEVIKEAYEFYQEDEWEGELIVRVPEMIGTYDKKKVDMIFKTQISELHNYYLKYILPDCKEFSNPDFHSIPLRRIKELSKYHGVVRGIDKSTSPFNENFLENNKYEDFLIPLQNCTVLPTSNPKLCAMHIFHELKRKFPIHAENRCLAFDLECCFNGVYYEQILEALKSKICKTLILLVTKMESPWNVVIKYLTEKLTEKKQIIIVTSTDICKELPQWKKLNYQWNDLSKNYQMRLLEKLITYQGRSITLKKVLNNCEKTKVMNPDVLWHIMSQDELSFGDGISSIRNERELYVERTFVRFVYKEDRFQMDQMPSHYLFITGVSELTVNLKKWSQTLSKYDDEIEKGKCIFVTKNEKNNSDFFKKFSSNIKKESKQVFWIHHTNGKYLLREPLERSEDIENHFVEETLDENQMLKETDGVSEVLVADDPGAGKSTSITSLIEKMKESYPEKLICRVNFGEHLHEFSASPSLPSLVEFLQGILKMNTPLEKMTFQEIIGVPRRVVVLFDGFDEMSIDLQGKALKILQHLREETQIQTWIFTRKHERLTLEEEMNIVSFSLRQFSFDDQLKYFNKFWLRSLISLYHRKKDFDEKFKEIINNLENYSGKCKRLLNSVKELVNLIEKENQEEFLKKINDLDFSDYSELVINSVKDSILKEKFIVPLWLWMMGNIILGSNFTIPDHRNRYEFYSDFMEKKVDYHLKKKRKLSPGSAYQDYNSIKKKIFRNLRKFSVKVMRSEHNEEILDLKKYDLKDKNLQELVHVGLLRKVGEEYHFFHMTFAEFLFSQMFVEEIKSGKLHSVDEKLLSDILIKDSYGEVRIFLDDFLVKDEIQSFIFPKILLQEFKVFKKYSEKYRKLCNNSMYNWYDWTGNWIWKRLFQSCEIHMKESVDEKSILNVCNGDFYFFHDVLDVLNSTFTDRMLFIIFDSRLDVSHEFLFRCLYGIKSNDFNAIMSIFKKIIKYKESHLRSEVPSTSNSLGNVKVGLELFEKEYKSQYYGNSVLHLMTERRKGKVLNELREIQGIIGNEKLNKLLKMQNKYGRTMLHILMEYLEDPKYVISVLEFLKGVMEEESFKQFLIQKDNKEIIPISCANLYILKDVLVFMGRYFSNEYIRDMLKKNKVRLGESIRYTDCALEEILYLEEFLGSELFQEILISKNKYEHGYTRLHYMMRYNERADKLFVRDLKVYNRLLDSDSMRDFLFSQDTKYYDGYTFLHIWAQYYRGSENFDIFHELHSILSHDAFEELLNIRKEFGKTFIHCFRSPLSEISSFLEKFLGKEKLIELVTDKDNFGSTRLHCIDYNYELICKDLKFYSELLDESSFRDFILTKDKWGKTFCYGYDVFGRTLKKFSDFNKLEGSLSPDLFLELQKTVKM